MHKIGLKDVPNQIMNHPTIKGNSDELLHFPAFSDNRSKIVIEFYDSMIEAIDLKDFHIMLDDDRDRINYLIEYENF